MIELRVFRPGHHRADEAELPGSVMTAMASSPLLDGHNGGGEEPSVTTEQKSAAQVL